MNPNEGMVAFEIHTNNQNRNSKDSSNQATMLALKLLLFLQKKKFCQHPHQSLCVKTIAPQLKIPNDVSWIA